MLVAAAALVVANSPWAASYFALLKTYIGGLSLLHWINDGLMAVFFLLVGLEIKREMVDGQLSTWSRRALPGVAAAGGMVVPAAIYVWINAETPNTLRGWAIPAATDIAFALGVLSLLGRRVPVSLKVFLTALAIIDDLGAVAIIAMFYTSELSITWLGLAFALLGVLFALNRARIDRLPIYLLVGVVLWYLVLKSGVHATLAGVALAIAIPVRPSPGKPDDAHSPLHVLEHSLRPWVGYLIVPIFGFANAGVSVVGLSLTAVLSPITIGVAAGLFFGKQFGVFLSTWLTVRSGLATRLEGASWGQVYGVSIIAGIGFTMSLFIGLLAFPDEALQDEVKIGVLLGSVASAIMGAAWLVACSNRAR